MDIAMAPVPTLPTAAALGEHLARLDQDGFTVIPGWMDRATTARLRAHVDALAPPPQPGAVSDLRHPIPGAIMAELITDAHLALARALLRGADDLRLLEQVLIRTCPHPTGRGATGWHIDWAFHPRHRAARPMQTYYQCVHALSDIAPGGGATMIVPGSHRLVCAAVDRIAAGDRPIAMERQDELKAEALKLAAIDPAQGVEITAREGDLVVFDPMCLHSASFNTGERSRYVLFQSFCDETAVDLNAKLEAMGYRSRFPDSLRDALPPTWRRLLRRP